MNSENGKLYGIGTGPGDSELLTLKAVRIMRECDVIALPQAKNAEKTAFKTVEEYIAGKPVLECSFSMGKDEEVRRSHRIKVADEVCEVLASGKSVGFITLGDPSIYSTYMYIHEIAQERGFEAEMIPGVASFSAVAAALNMPLCEGGEQLHIIPASGNESIGELLDLDGTKVIMKSGKSLTDVISLAKERGLSDKTKIVERCTMDGERIFNSADELLQAEKDGYSAGYFAVAVIKP